MTKEFIKQRIKEQDDYILSMKGKYHLDKISYNRVKLLLQSANEIRKYFKEEADGN